MKLYEEDGYIYLDYTDVDPEAPLNAATAEYREFVRESGCDWDRTLKPKVKQYRTHIECKRDRFEAMGGLSMFLGRLQSLARYGRGYIEVDDSFNKFLRKVDSRYKELYEIEKAKAEQRKLAEHWKYLCKRGCKGCSNLRCIGDDDYECGATGDCLEVKNVPERFGKVYQLFNYIPFPTDDCPFNTNKTKETDYEHLREYYGSSG